VTPIGDWDLDAQPLGYKPIRVPTEHGVRLLIFHVPRVFRRVVSHHGKLQLMSGDHECQGGPVPALAALRLRALRGAST
jgi:hypothetical protein